MTDLSAAEISNFPNYPFKVRVDEEMERPAKSVKEWGILLPLMVRPMPDGNYQMVSGHRRKRAAELAELPVLPCIVRELADDEAIIVVVDSNLQREQVLLSEKGKVNPDVICSIMQEEKPNQVEQFKRYPGTASTGFPCGDARTEDRGHHRESVGDVAQGGKGEGTMANVTPRGKSALLWPWHFPRPLPLTLSPCKW